MNVADQPAIVHVTHDALNRIKSHFGVRRVVHGKDNAGHDLDHQRKAGQRPEVPRIVQIARSRVVHHVMLGVAEKRQPVVEPAHDADVKKAFHVCYPPAQPTTMVVSSVKA